MEKAIILLAHGSSSYGKAAFNAAMSIKYHGAKTPIVLFCEHKTMDNISTAVFDKVIYIPEDFYTKDNKRNVALSKINLVRDLPAKYNLFIDADSMVLCDIDPLIDRLIKTGKPYMSEWMGEGKYGEDISYDCWAKHDVAFPFFGLDVEKTTWRTIQSSWAFFEKCDFTGEMYDLLLYYLEKGYDLKDLRQAWAAYQLPDELLFEGVCAKMEYDPRFDGLVIFFGNKHIDTSYSDLSKQYFILSLFGQGQNAGRTQTKTEYLEWYSREMSKMSRELRHPYYKQEEVMQGKILNNWLNTNHRVRNQ